MKKVLICGYLGFGNFGDEALLHVLIKDLVSVGFRKEDIAVLSQNPQTTAEKFSVSAINRLNLFDIFSGISNCEAVIFIGGLFQDKTSFRSLLYYLFLLLLSELLNKKIVFYGVGIGPFQRTISKILFELALKYVSLLTVRDQGSLEHIPYHGSSMISCDPVWTIETDGSFKNQITNINWQLPILGLSFRNDKALKSNHLIRIVEKLARVLDGMKDWQILLIPCMLSEDLPILYEVQDLLSKKSASNKVALLDNFAQFSVTQQAGILASCSIVIGMRYHSLVVPLANGKPVFGLIYDAKVRSVLEFANQVGISFKDKDDLDHVWSYFWQNIQYSTDMAKKTRDKAIQLHKKNIELLQALLNS